MKFDIVLGVDRGHIEHLRVVWANWQERKPSLFEHRFIIFYDDSVNIEELDLITGGDSVLYVSWNPGCAYVSDGDRWSDPQRQQMLSGFVYVASEVVQTEYWLKLDLDVIAESDDDWVELSWFSNSPAIVAHRWGYTKPADQMLKLDAWAAANQIDGQPLELSPQPGSSMVSHKRIISWCAFFETRFTQDCIRASMSEPYGKLPVPSQDGFMWYLATRWGLPVNRVNMKAKGWSQRSTLSAVREKIGELDAC